jgi:hypothetical protein
MMPVTGFASTPWEARVKVEPNLPTTVTLASLLGTGLGTSEPHLFFTSSLTLGFL